MCGQCVAQGALYAGGSIVALRVMGARARARARRQGRDETAVVTPDADDAEPTTPTHASVQDASRI
jgi:hypothetical protein